MPAYTLYAHLLSQPSRAVEWILRLKDVEHTFEETSPLTGATRTPEFLKINPQGHVPVLHDHDRDLVLGESHAIMVYLAEKHEWTDLYPTDLVQRARVNQYLHWHHSGARKSTTQVLVPLIHDKIGKATNADHDFIKAADDTIRGFLTAIEDWLSKAAAAAAAATGSSGFLAHTSSPSLADFSCYCELDQLELMGKLPTKDFPHVAAWVEKMKQVEGHDDVHVTIGEVLGQFGLKAE